MQRLWAIPFNHRKELNIAIKRKKNFGICMLGCEVREIYNFANNGRLFQEYIKVF